MFTGTVVDKKYYPGQAGKPESIVGSKASAFIAPAQAATPEGWSVIVEGTDKPGGKVKKHELYVDAMTWATVEKGSAWPVKGA